MPFKKVPLDFLSNKDDPKQQQSSEDTSSTIQNILALPWANAPDGSYLYYDCKISAMLDSGIVVHNRLPTVDKQHDTLGSTPFDNPKLNKITDQGVNLKSNDQYKDIVQRMAHSRYWFRLWGEAIRITYKVPIPFIKSIGGVPAIPHDENPQMAYNHIVPGGNFGGVILWLARWSLWYTTDSPPTNNYVPAANPSALVNAPDLPNGNAPVPRSIRAPFSLPDDKSIQSSNPPSNISSDIRTQGKPSTR